MFAQEVLMEILFPKFQFSLTVQRSRKAVNVTCFQMVTF